MLKRIKEIINLAIPAVGEMMLYMLIWVADTLMVGKYGGQLGVSAVGLSSEIMYTFINIIVAMGLSIAITSIVAQLLGAKKNNEAHAFASESLRLGVLIAILIASIFFTFSKQILSASGAENKVLTLGASYMRICSIGMLFNMFSNLLNGIFRGCKDTKSPLYGAFVLNIVNISLDYLLIFGKFGFPELGINGAAIATTLGNVFCFLLLLKRIKTLPFKLSLKENIKLPNLKLLSNLAVPSAMQEAAFSIARLLGVFMVIRLGSLAFSANQIVVTIESISFMPGWGFAICATSLVGHSKGEKNFKKAKEYAWDSLLLACTTMGISAIIFLFFSKELVGLFIKADEVEVIKLGSKCLMIGAIQQIPTAISMVLGGVLKGNGDSKTPFKASLFSNWALRVPLMYYFIYLKKMPITYFWWITTAQWSLEAIILFYLYKKNFLKKENEWN